MADARILGLVAKRFLAGDGIHYEPRWFKPWPAGARDEFIAPDGDVFPIGDLHFEVGGVRLGFEICEDAWVANRPGAALEGSAPLPALTRRSFVNGSVGWRRPAPLASAQSRLLQP